MSFFETISNKKLTFVRTKYIGVPVNEPLPFFDFHTKEL